MPPQSPDGLTVKLAAAEVSEDGVHDCARCATTAHVAGPAGTCALSVVDVVEPARIVDAFCGVTKTSYEVAPLTADQLTVTGDALVAPCAGAMREGGVVEQTSALTLIDAERVAAQLPLVTVTATAIGPDAPAENVMLDVPWPPVIVPPVIVQLKIEPAGAIALTMLPVEFASTDAGALIVTLGGGVTVIVCEADPLQPPASVTLTV